MEMHISQVIFTRKNIPKTLSSTKWENNTVVILHIYGARDIFTLFNDDQGTEK